ncbi:MAG: hypothetical protein EZS28_000506 [Streblomastix strix]|uniref:Uncharacterized protein n=1 Tax=Streblomastix strix TaxID=222440 RepID=A0A5J4XA31_9EUKA|nr:MAG: hypothetical protein EZS28_000506 [Streblomastix strix]
MSIKSSDYLGRLSNSQRSDYVGEYMQLGEVLKSLSIHPQFFEISKQNFFNSSITELTSSGVKYTRTLFGARDKSARLIVQTFQLLNEILLQNQMHELISIVKKIQQLIGRQMLQATLKYYSKTADGREMSGHLQLWIGFSTACGPFNQFYQLKDATTLYGSAIYSREQAVISGNSLSDLCIKNSVRVSPLESMIEGKRHNGVFIDIRLREIDRQATAETVTTPFYYKIPQDITFCQILDLNQLNPIQKFFPVHTRNYATLHLQLQISDFLQDLKKPDIVYLLAKIGEVNKTLEYERYNVRIVNIPTQNQNYFKQFIGTRAYPDPTKTSITLMMHYLYDAFAKIIFDESSIPYVLNIGVIEELAGRVIEPQ